MHICALLKWLNRGADPVRYNPDSDPALKKKPDPDPRLEKISDPDLPSRIKHGSAVHPKKTDRLIYCTMYTK